MTAPLCGKKILITRPKDQAEELSALFRAQGADTYLLPLISIREPESWEAFDQATAHLDSFDWVIFASANAARATVNRLRETGNKEALAALKKVKIGAMGKATVQTLSDIDLVSDYTPSAYVAETFLAEFPDYPNLTGKKIFWPKTNIGRPYLGEKLQAAGAELQAAVCYQTSGPEDPEAAKVELFRLLDSIGLDVLTLTSSEAARSLHKLSGGYSKAFSRTCLAAIGPETARTVKELFGKVDLEAKEFSGDGLVKAVQAYFSERVL